MIGCREEERVVLESVEDEEAYLESVEDRTTTEPKTKWHIRQWYKEHYGVDPAKLPIEPRVVKNPHFSTAAPMKLWLEDDIEPHKSEIGIETFNRRRSAGLKAATTKRNKMIEWFKEIKNSDPRVHAITKRLWEIGERINELHTEKENCRGPDADKREFFEYGMEHCEFCEARSREQAQLRYERRELFEALESACGKDKQTIQLARRYCREEHSIERPNLFLEKAANSVNPASEDCEKAQQEAICPAYA